MAGITGPCPYCQVLIQAPYAIPQPPTQAAPTPIQPQPQQYDPQYYQPQSPPPQQAPEYYAPPRPEPQYQHREPQSPQGLPTVLRPAPRQLPDRTEPLTSPTRARRDPSGDIRPRDEAAGLQAHRPHRGRLVRALVPLLFLCVILAVIFGMKAFLQMDPSKDGGKNPGAVTESGGSAVEHILPADSFDDLTGGGTETLPVGDSDMPHIGEISSVPPADTIDSGIAALNLLEEFLDMKSLEERLPHLETKRGEDVLASSVLNGPLPKAVKITVDVREIKEIEELTDHYYHVDFADADGGINPQTMLVRTRGTAPPKVVVDPFLDLFGGRFARFAAEPTEEAGTFLVIISAGGGSYADIDNVPEPEKKLTMKILARENTKEIAKAYFGKQSQIGRMLNDETSGLSYGLAKACTVFMRWNMDDDPERPFLEALDIKALSWNP